MFMNNVLRVFATTILFIPRLTMLVLNLVFTRLYEAVHKKEITKKAKELSVLAKEKFLLKEENTSLKEKLLEYNAMVEEIENQVMNGKTLLGIHHIQSNRLQHDPVAKEYVKKVYTIYYMYHQQADSETFFIRAHFAGQIQKFVADRKSCPPHTPENTAFIFRIEGSIYKSTQAIRLHQLDTAYDFRNLGIASLGIDYLKKIAINNGVKKINGITDNNEIARKFLPKFYEDKGFKVIYPQNNLSNIGFEMQL